MKDFDFSESVNLYYLDQIGSVDDQLDFLSNLSIQDAQFCVTGSSELVNLCVFLGNYPKPFSKLVVVRPGLNIRSFSDFRVVNFPRWLVNHDFYCYQIVKSFKYKNYVV